MLPSQRDAFDIPRDVCYLNAASWSPLPRAVQAAGHEGVDRKARPWAVAPGLARAQHERTRAAAGFADAFPAVVFLDEAGFSGSATPSNLSRANFSRAAPASGKPRAAPPLDTAPTNASNVGWLGAGRANFANTGFMYLSKFSGDQRNCSHFCAGRW